MWKSSGDMKIGGPKLQETPFDLIKNIWEKKEMPEV